MIGALAIASGSAAGAIADSPEFKRYLAAVRELTAQKLEGKHVGAVAIGSVCATGPRGQTPYWKLYDALPSIVGEEAGRFELQVGTQALLELWSDRIHRGLRDEE
jgi:hypothetical protein